MWLVLRRNWIFNLIKLKKTNLKQCTFFLLSILLHVKCPICILLITCWNDNILQGSPTPRPWTSTGLCPVRNWAAQQEVSGGRASEASSVFTAAPHHSHYRLSSASCQHYGELYNYFIIYYNVIIIEIKCTINVTCLNHPKTIPTTPSMEKLSSTKPVPGAKKVGERWYIRCSGLNKIHLHYFHLFLFTFLTQLLENFKLYMWLEFYFYRTALSYTHFLFSLSWFS